MHQLFALGSNGSGQLGIGHTSDVSVPKPVLLGPSAPPDSTIISIAAGGNHTVLLLSSGTLLCTGDATSGAIGHPEPSSSPPAAEFHPLPTPSPGAPATHIAATWTTTLFAAGSPATQLYSLGTGLKGELGLGPLVVRTAAPSLVPDFPPAGTHIVQLAASMAHAVAVLSDGTAWGWGAARKGQLGPVPVPGDGRGRGVEGVVYEPRRIEGAPFPVVRAACGKEFTCLFGASEGGEVVVLGSDKWGMRTGVPPKEDLVGWKDVGAGWGNVHVLLGDGRVVSWGRHDHGQLAPGDLPRTVKLAVGSEHALALSEEGEVTAWGWGEHGNCGPGQEHGGKGQRGVIASRKYVPKGSEIAAIAAGCATSWVIIELPEET